jgi:REP element-mobilizing transposase RayT
MNHLWKQPERNVERKVEYDYFDLATDSDGRIHPPPGTFIHVTTRCNLERTYLEQREAKELLQELIQHYARVGRYSVVHYSLMGNHLHLILEAQDGSEALDKIIGNLKAQFTRKYKRLRKKQQPDYSSKKWGVGTLWAGPYHAKGIKSDLYLHNCVFYVEANHLQAYHADVLRDLLEPPNVPRGLASLEDECELALGSDYDALVEEIRAWPWHSGRYYLSETVTEDPVLTDGTDAVWASEEEVERYFNHPLSDLPEGWKKVYFNGRRRILKPTPEEERRYPVCPVWSCLGEDHVNRARRFAVGLLDSVWRATCRDLDDEDADIPPRPMLVRLDIFTGVGPPDAPG